MYNSATFLKNEIVSMREAFAEKDIKQTQAILSLRMMLGEKDRQHFLAVEGTRKLRAVILRCERENDKLKLELKSQKENLRRCKHKNKIEQEKINAESQSVRENLLKYEHENVQLKLELEYQKENLRRCKDSNKTEQEQLKTENQNMCEVMLRCQHENDQLKLDLESQKENLTRCKESNSIEQEKLNSENQNLRGIMLKYKQENDQLKLDLKLQKEDLRRCTENNKIEQEMLSAENQFIREIMLVCQQENDRVKLDLESQKENNRRCNDNNRIEREKLNAEYQKVRETMLRCQYKNELLELDLGFQKENLKRCEDKNKIELEKLNADNQKLKTRLNELEWQFALANPDGIHNTLKLKENLDRMNKELEEKAGQMLDMESHNQSLVVEMQMARHELERAHKELIGVKNRLYEKEKEANALKKELEEIIDDTQAVMSVNQALLVKERISTDELQKARQQLMTGLSDFLTHRTNIGIKRMGELDQKPFRDACLEKISGEAYCVKAAELCSLWERNIQNPQWHPFKRIRSNSESGAQEVETVDDDDETLKELKYVWGQQVYEAVSVALSEINEYNPSGRYPIPELWNFKEGRKSDLREVIEYLIKQLKSFKSAAKSLKRRQ